MRARHSTHIRSRLKRITKCIAVIAVSILPSQPGFTQASELSQSLEKIRREHNIAGLYLVSQKNGITSEITLGVTDHQSKIPITPDHYVRLGSVSKLFLGLTLLKLARTDDTILTSPASRWGQPPLFNPWSSRHPVTLAQLLEHTAGLTDMSRLEFDSNKPLSLAEAFDVDPDSRRLKWPAGLHASYSNSGAGIAAWAVEQIAEQSYQQTVKAEVFTPLGLNSATYEASQPVLTGLMTGYDTDGTTPIDYWHTIYPAFGGINLKISDLKTLLSVFIEPNAAGEFTLAELKRMHTPTTTLAAGTGLTYGYGLGLYDYSSHGFEFVGHGGDADGYLTFFGFSPEHQLGFFVVINAFNYRAMSRAKRMIHQHLTSGLTPGEKPATARLSQKDIALITGTYQPASYRFKAGSEIRVFEQDGRLFTRFNKQVQPLIPVTTEHFRRPHEPVATIAITTHEGNRYLQSDEGNFQRSPSKKPTLTEQGLK